jgi:hypothetical protein
MRLQNLIKLIKEDFWQNPTYRDGKEALPNTLTTCSTRIVAKHIKDLTAAHQLVGEVAALKWEMDNLFVDLDDADWYVMFRELALGAIILRLRSDPALAKENAEREKAFP